MTFMLSREAAIPSRGVVYQEFHDTQSGAKHIHLKSTSSENAFMVSFPTVPRSDDGRAHILEHLSLCGSKKYPTRDPFFSMTRRSLATFMNAMTYPDRTVYPFASQDRKDFFNLLDVYLDAAFFPNLDPLDFQQEGWRLSFDEAGKLSYNGVVFNEMKEPTSSASFALWHGIQSAIKPGTTYSFQSGGDPLAIPTLTHPELVDFHTTHYHPSRAVFWSYGDIDPKDIQARIASEVLSKISTRLERIEPDSAERSSAPRKIDIHVPSQGERSEHGFQMAWLLGETARDHELINDWQIFSEAVSGGSASPISLALEGAGFGRPGMVGIDTGSRQATFLLGMEGLEQRDIPKARATIFACLERIAKDGIPEERLESVLRDFEMQSQDISGGRVPHGLQSLLAMVSEELNGGEPLRALDVKAALSKARHDIKNPDFIKAMARRLIEAPARVEARVIPDPDFLPARAKREADALSLIQASLTPKQIDQIKSQNEQLLARQRAKPDTSCLPNMRPSDVSRQLPTSLAVEFSAGGPKPSQAFVPAPTNGVGSFGLVLDASCLSEADWPWFILGADLAMNLGFGDMDFEQAELWRSERGSYFNSSTHALKASARSGGGLALHLCYGVRSMEPDASTMADALARTAISPRFNEHERIAFLIQSRYQSALQNIAQAGAGLAASAATAGFGALGAISQATSGIARLRFMEKLDALSRSPEGLLEIQCKFESIFDSLKTAPTLITYIGSREASIRAFDAARLALGHRPGMASMDAVDRPGSRAGEPDMARVALHGPGQLNYCHAVWSGPEQSHPDCGPMMVLGAFLDNTFLHRAVREEGGAYGASAGYQSTGSYFAMSSYRDPRVGGTYADFDAAIDAVVSAPIEQSDLEEAIISIMQNIDRPGTPREQAQVAMSRLYSGFTDDQRLALRHSVLDTTADDLRRVAKTYLQGQPCNQAAYICPTSAAEADALGMENKPVIHSVAKLPTP